MLKVNAYGMQSESHNSLNLRPRKNYFTLFHVIYYNTENIHMHVTYIAAKTVDTLKLNKINVV